MIINYCTVDASFRYLPAETDEFTMDETLDQIVDHLYELGVEDLNVVADTVKSIVDISLAVPAHSGDSIETVIGKAMGMLRTAFHACDAGTPGWPSTSWEMLLTASVKPTPMLPVDAPAAPGREAVPA